MFAGSLAAPAERVAVAAQSVMAAAGNPDQFHAAIALLHGHVAELWSIAVGEAPT
jgi:hypothetical protein